MKENPKIKRWELSLSPMGMVHFHYEILLSNVLQDGMGGGLARELHQVADELTRLATRKSAVTNEASQRVGGLAAKAAYPSS